MHSTQPYQIKKILEDLILVDKNVMTKPIPSSSSQLMLRHSESKVFDVSSNYQSVIGKYNYLENSTRINIMYITPQCALLYGETICIMYYVYVVW